MFRSNFRVAALELLDRDPTLLQRVESLNTLLYCTAQALAGVTQQRASGLVTRRLLKTSSK